MTGLTSPIVPLPPATEPPPPPPGSHIRQIRPEQYQAFSAMGVARFRAGWLRHAQKHFRAHCKILGETGLGQVVERAFERAAPHGMKSERDMYLWLALMLYLGSRFDDDCQLPWVRQALADPDRGTPAERVEICFDAAMLWIDRVLGDDNQHITAAIQRFYRLFQMLPLDARVTRDDLREMLQRVWPEKCAAAGAAGVDALVEHAARTAAALGIGTPRGAILLGGLMLIAGSGIHEDPQFPWVARVCRDPAHATPEARVAALQEAASAEVRAWWAAAREA